MEEINLNEYKVIVFENGEFVFKGLKSPDITHGDYLRQYVDKKIEDNKYNNNLLNQIKRVDALDYMVDNIILLTNSQVVLNSGFGFFFVLSKNITKEEIDNLKSYSKVFNEADTLLFERAFIEDNIPGIFDAGHLDEIRRRKLGSGITSYIRLFGIKKGSQAALAELRNRIIECGTEEGIQGLRFRRKIGFLVIRYCPWLIRIVYPLRRLFRPIKRKLRSVMRKLKGNG